MECVNCNKELGTGPADAHEYVCINCGAKICETCHYKLTVLRKDPKPGQSNCKGVDCPKCKKIIHFNEQ